MAETRSPAHGRGGWLARWWLAIVWIGLICVLSSSSFSFNHTLSFEHQMARLFFPSASAATNASIHLLMRKGAHFSIYAILFLVLAAGPLRVRPWVALLLCVAAAAGDEIHQIFLPDRTASIYDVALDATGALFGRFLYAAMGWGESETGAVEDGGDTIHAAEEGAQVAKLGPNP